MTDVVNVATRSRMMAGIKGKDTTPELFLRKALHAQGLRYRLGGCGLPGKPDLVFPSRKTVVFVHGCFWHQHHCKYFKWPATNADFWKEKLTKNANRDTVVAKKLRELGWAVITVWECALKETTYQQPSLEINRVVTELNKVFNKKT